MKNLGFRWFCQKCVSDTNVEVQCENNIFEKLNEIKTKIDMDIGALNSKLVDLDKKVSTSSWASIVAGDQTQVDTKDSNDSDKNNNNRIIDFAKQVVNNHK